MTYHKLTIIHNYDTFQNHRGTHCLLTRLTRDLLLGAWKLVTSSGSHFASLKRTMRGSRVGSRKADEENQLHFNTAAQTHDCYSNGYHHKWLFWGVSHKRQIIRSIEDWHCMVPIYPICTVHKSNKCPCMLQIAGSPLFDPLIRVSVCPSLFLSVPLLWLIAPLGMVKICYLAAQYYSAWSSIMLPFQHFPT